MVLAIAFFLPQPARAGLIGTIVTTTFESKVGAFSATYGPQDFIVGSTNLSCPGDGPTGSLCDHLLGPSFRPYTITFSDSEIMFNSEYQAGAMGNANWSTGTFVGWVFTYQNPSSAIIGASFTDVGYPAAQPVIVFTANSVSINLQGVTTAQNNSWAIELQTSTVPEPSNFGLISICLVGLAAYALRSINN